MKPKIIIKSVFTIAVIIIIALLVNNHGSFDKCDNGFKTYYGKLNNQQFSFQYPCSWRAYPDNQTIKERGLRIKNPENNSGLIYPSFGGSIDANYNLTEYETEISGQPAYARAFDYENNSIVYIRFEPDDFSKQLIYYYDKGSNDKEILENAVATMVFSD